MAGKRGGAYHHKTQLANANARADKILELREQGVLITDLAVRFQVAPPTITKILERARKAREGTVA